MSLCWTGLIPTQQTSSYGTFMGLKASRGHTVTDIGTALLHTSYVEHYIVFNTLDDFKVFILSYVKLEIYCKDWF